MKQSEKKASGHANKLIKRASIVLNIPEIV
jgi:hypothetical protein